MDRAVEPNLKSKPKRTLIVLLSAFAAGLISIALAFMLEAAEGAKNDPKQAQRLALLKMYLGLRRPG